MNTPSITVIYKDKTKKTIKLSELVEIRDDLRNMVLLEIDTNTISKIQLKNFNFSNLFKQRRLRIRTINNNDCNLILEDCIFSNELLEFSCWKKVQVVNPIFKLTTSPEIKICDSDTAIVTLSNTKIKLSFESIKNLNLNSVPFLNKVELKYITNLVLNNISEEELKFIQIINNINLNNLTITNSKVNNFTLFSTKNLTLINTTLTNTSINNSIKELHLESSTIKTKDELKLPNLEKLTLDTTSSLISNKNISLGRLTYYRESTEDKIILSLDSYNSNYNFIKQRFLFLLKEIIEKSSKENSLLMDTILEKHYEEIRKLELASYERVEEYKKYIEQILLDLIEIEQSKLETNLNESDDNIIEELEKISKRKIKTITNKGIY